ncbi:MAG: FtsX-like permease family protein [Bacteriovoracaceae bacterium]|nr:FtsX-like permease family protein [Bacteriovoracaceae bacterium]
MIKFILKGLIYDRQRSWFPIIVIALGVMLTTLLYCYMQGVSSDMVDINAKIDTGHVKIMTHEYAKIASQVPNDLAIWDLSKFLNKIKKEYPIDWVARIKFGGLLDIPDDKRETKAQSTVFGMAFDLLSKNTTEIDRLKLKLAIVRGRLPQNPGEIVISEKLANSLQIKLGEAATLISSTSTGNMAVHNFLIVGTTHFGISNLDRNIIIADISDIQYALDMEDAASELLGFLPTGFNKAKALKIKSNFNSPQMTMLTLADQNGLGEYLDLIGIKLSIIISVFVLAMSIVLWNTGLMSGIRRYGEIGLRLAIGESKEELYLSMILEAILVGIIGSLIGTVLGLLAAYYLQEVGIDTSELLKGSKMLMSTTIRAKITTTSYFIGFVPGILSMLFGTMIAGVGIFKRETASLFYELDV